MAPAVLSFTSFDLLHGQQQRRQHSRNIFATLPNMTRLPTRKNTRPSVLARMNGFNAFIISTEVAYWGPSRNLWPCAIPPTKSAPEKTRMPSIVHHHAL